MTIPLMAEAFMQSIGDKLSKREIFAAIAMNGILSNYLPVSDSKLKHLIKDAVTASDLLIEELDGSKK